MSGSPLFAPHPGDPEDVLWHLQAAQALGAKGQLGDAAGWLRRAAEAASKAGLLERAAELTSAAALLEQTGPGASEASGASGERISEPERLSLEIDLSELAASEPEPPPRPPILDPWSDPSLEGVAVRVEGEGGSDDPSSGDRPSAEVLTSAAPLEVALATLGRPPQPTLPLGTPPPVRPSAPAAAPLEPASSERPASKPPSRRPAAPRASAPPGPRAPGLREVLGMDLALAAAPGEALDRLAAEAVGVDFGVLGPGATSVAARPAALLLEEGELAIEAVLSAPDAASGAALRREIGRVRPGDLVLLEPIFERPAPAAPPLALGASTRARGFAWSEAALRRALEGAASSMELLSARERRLRALSGAASGPLGGLDGELRAALAARLWLLHLPPGASLVQKGEKASGVCIVGAGSVNALGASLGPGAFVFAEARLHERPSPGDALAGPEGALVLLGDRATGQELLVTVPAFIDLFLGA